MIHLVLFTRVVTDNLNILFNLDTSFVMRRFPALVAAVLSAGLLTHASPDGNAESDSSLFWGTYRPNLYFGLRPRVPNTLMTGLMWHGLNDYQSLMSELAHKPLMRLSS